MAELGDVALVAVRIDAVESTLHDVERTAVSRAVDKRVREFAAGRYAARCALGDLGLEPAPIPRAEDRRPLWPDGVVGSITHADRIAVAGIGQSRRWRGLGLDLEACGRITPELHGKLFTDRESARYRQQTADWPTLLFSAKEAAYKAVNPVVGRFIGFQEVEVDVDWDGGAFRLRYVGGHEPNRIMDAGVGRFAFADGYALTVFQIGAEGHRSAT
jgi:4'-phosphopantetheinyl transferase EntD